MAVLVAAATPALLLLFHASWVVAPAHPEEASRGDPTPVARQTRLVLGLDGGGGESWKWST